MSETTIFIGLYILAFIALAALVHSLLTQKG